MPQQEVVVTMDPEKRVNANISLRKHEALRERFVQHGIRTSEGARIGTNMFAAALPTLGVGGQVVFRDGETGQEKAYTFPLPSQNLADDGKKRLHASMTSRQHDRLRSRFAKHGIRMADAIRIGANLFAAALPTLAAGGEIIFREPDGKEKIYVFPFFMN